MGKMKLQRQGKVLKALFVGPAKYFGPISNGNIKGFEVRGPCLNLHVTEHGNFSVKKGFNATTLDMERTDGDYCSQKETIVSGPLAMETDRRSI